MSPKPKGFVAWYDKLTDWSVEDLFVRPRPPGPPRSVFVNQPLPDRYLDKKHRVKKEHKHVSNQVITSKYTIITFLPRNLLEQFRRIANIFFAGIAILQFFSKFSTISPGLVILPLIVVWGITALKDGYEDIKRHQSDRHVNYSEVRVLHAGGWRNPNPMQSKFKTFVRALPRRSAKKHIPHPHAGDIQMLGGAVPPEAIEDRSPEESPEPDAGVETYGAGVPMEEYDDRQPPPAHHDGLHVFGTDEHDDDRPHWKRTIWEDLRVGDIVKLGDHESVPADLLICSTSEDENVCFVETKNLDGETNLKSRHAVPALTHMHSAAACTEPAFEIDCDRPEPHMFKLNAAVVMRESGERVPVDLQMCLLRGTVIRNTEWVIGVVMYTGRDTKLVLNAGGTPSKRSKVERQMNPMVFANLVILGIMATVCAIVDSVLEHHYYPRGALWLFADDQPDDNPSINGLVTWAFALITFQNIVPISLYISIEVVRTCQAAFIYFDKEIWYEKTDQPTLARSWNLSDDLGQIEYIFSDKTGTLTQNAMVFRRCSIAGKVYVGDEPKLESPSDTDYELPKSPSALARDLSAGSGEVRLPSGSEPIDLDKPEPTVIPAHGPRDPRTVSRVKLSGGVLEHYCDSALAADVHAASGDTRARIDRFWTTLALCHTVLAGVERVSGALEYKAQSPDEAALVQAAADVGWEFRGRERDVLFLRTPYGGRIAQHWRLLAVLEFTSARKRMSVVVRRLAPRMRAEDEKKPGPREGEADDAEDVEYVEEGPLLLLTKGADSVIFERLAVGGDAALRAATEAQLDEFAREGLRTLTLACREVPADEFERWTRGWQEANAAIDEREEKVEALADELEKGLELVGATAIEDRLQDGVPEAIADLKRAGIKIWVATGDKLETAIAIGHSTNLIGAESNIIIIRGTTGDVEADGARAIYAQMLRAAEEYFPETDILADPLVEPYELGKLDATQRRSSSEGENPLRRVTTGVSSIVGSNNGHRPGGYVLVIDGLALTDALSDDKHKHLLLKLAMLCEGVVCCRTSPKQKALVVRLVKDGIGAMTLAIGDGANDVSMIQAADVGVGISGEEGLQAVNSSDYAIAQFRFLKRLLLVHGHWSYARNGNMIVNFFYKNIICIGVLWWFQIYAAWSSSYVLEYTYLLFWNSFWTLCPVIAIGLFDRIVDDRVLMALPELYRYGREGRWFGFTEFTIYMIDGIVQSAIIFFLILYAYFSPSARDDGWQVGQYEFSTVMAISAVMAANLFIGMNTNVWTGWVFFAVLVGIVLVWAYTAIYAAISPGWFVTPVYGNDSFLFPSPLFWFGVTLPLLLALAPRYIWKAWQFGFHPNDIDIMRWNHKLNPRLDIAREAYMLSKDDVSKSVPMVPLSPYGRGQRPSTPGHPSLASLARGSQIDMSTGVRSQSRGFDFAQEENGVAMRRMQSNLSGMSSLPPVPERRSKRGSHLLATIRHPLRRKRPPTGAETPLKE